jgi:thiamine pyrophosphate-dependent acetolactate synthase large subunit-like protein
VFVVCVLNQQLYLRRHLRKVFDSRVEKQGRAGHHAHSSIAVAKQRQVHDCTQHLLAARRPLLLIGGEILSRRLDQAATM